MRIVSTKKRKPAEFSKQLADKVYCGGMRVIYLCLVLIAFAIYRDSGAAATALTAAVGVAESMIMLVSRKYLALAEADHSEGGITYEAAKATNFNVQREDATI